LISSEIQKVYVTQRNELTWNFYKKTKETTMLERLNDDVIGCVFTFLPLPDVHQLGLSNNYLSQFLQNDSPIWQSLLSRYVNESQHQQLLSRYHSYKTAVKEETLLKFDIKSLNPKFFGPDALTFSNNNRTVTCSRKHNWVAIKTTKQIYDDVLYAWKVVLDTYSNCDNEYKVFIGLDNDKFPYHDQNTLSDIIGYSKSTGYSYNCGTCDTHVKSNVASRGPHIKFQDGDIIQCVLDTRYPNSIRSAKFSLCKLEGELSAIELCSLTIDLKEDEPFYPAVALIQGAKLTLKPCNNIIWPTKALSSV
jgi:hypothetical protein